MISPTSKRFVVVPQGGLGNRMRVIRSAYELARSGYGDVHVAFARNNECYCRFEDVFGEINPPYKISALHRQNGLMRPLRYAICICPAQSVLCITICSLTASPRSTVRKS